MQTITLDSFNKFLTLLDGYSSSDDNIVLYRGQSDQKSLLPSICRDNPKIDTTKKEIAMLNELKRRVKTFTNKHFETDWDWLVYAQHFGMHTRLLDWTSNPLAALWFACANSRKSDQDSYVYVFVASEKFLLDKSAKETPFNHDRTRILKPNLNNERVLAQSGWFTAHKFSKSANSFVPLERNKELKSNIFEVVIPSHLKHNILNRLNILGINGQTMFPDTTGVCKHINWEFRSK